MARVSHNYSTVAASVEWRVQIGRVVTAAAQREKKEADNERHCTSVHPASIPKASRIEPTITTPSTKTRSQGI